jgi:hypothetical protein
MKILLEGARFIRTDARSDRQTYLIETRIFGTDFRKIIQIPNFIKIRPVGGPIYPYGRTVGQTD